MTTDIDEVAEATAAILERFAENDKLVSQLAKFVRKLYLALVNEGFTEEQALNIISKQGMFGK